MEQASYSSLWFALKMYYNDLYLKSTIPDKECSLQIPDLNSFCLQELQQFIISLLYILDVCEMLIMTYRWICW